MAAFSVEDMEAMNYEVLECARYGEDEDLLQLLSDGANVNHCDENGNSALHRSAANGHLGCIHILLDHGIIYTPNAQGNTPIHWATQNLQFEALKLLFDRCGEMIDVTQQNSFGRSTMTEAFDSKNDDIIALCLSHPSAAEDRMLRDQSKIKIDSDENDDSNKIEEDSDQNAVFHDFYFIEGGEKCVRIRELPITRADQPFGSDSAPEEDTTGLAIWPAAILLSRWIANCENHLMSMIRNKRVLELGAGCGVPGLAAAVYCNPRVVFISDINSASLDNAAFNIRLNGQVTENIDNAIETVLTSASESEKTTVCVSNLNWMDLSTFPNEPVDTLIGSDLVYDVNILSALIFSVANLLVLSKSFILYLLFLLLITYCGRWKLLVCCS